MTIKNILVLFAAFVCCCEALYAKTTKQEYVIINSGQVALQNKIVILNVDVDWARSAVVFEGKREIPSQMDDHNGDGVGDELVLIVDLHAGGRKEYKVVYSDSAAPQAKPVVGVEGRNVLQWLSNADVGSLSGWDISTLRATPIVAQAEAQPSAVVISSGPIRTVVETMVKGWQQRDSLFDIKSRYTLYAHHRELLVEHVVVGDLDRVQLCTGVGKWGNSPSAVDERGNMAVWSEQTPRTKVIAGAVVVPQEYILGRYDDSLRYLYRLIPDKLGRVRYTAVVVEQGADNEFGTDSKRFFDYIDNYKSIELQAPLKIYRGQIKKVGIPGDRVERLIVK